MATFRKRASGRIQAIIRREGEAPMSRTFKSRKDAEQWTRGIESKIDDGKFFGAARTQTLADLIDAFKQDADVVKTQADRSRRLDWFRSNFGGLRLMDVPTKLAEMKRMLAVEIVGTKAKPKRRSPQTQRHYLSALSRCLRFARDELRWIEALPHIPKPKTDNKVVAWLSEDETQKLLEAARQSKNPDLHLVVLIALTSGARYSEIVHHLTWRTIDFQREAAFIPTSKTGEARTLPLVPEVLDALRERSKVRRIGTDLVFPSPENPKKPRNMRQAWDVARKRAGLQAFRFHDMRHAAATRMLRSGTDFRIVGAVLGHKSLASMIRYQHVIADQVVAAAKRANVKKS